MKTAKGEGIMTRIRRRGLAVLMGLTLLIFGSVAWAGPVILGGDDLDDHGSGDGTTNFLGWLYIERAIDNLNSQVTRPGPFTVDIAALGSADNPACPPACSGGDSGDAIKSAASVLGLTVDFFEGAASITQFFTDLASGAVNPRIIRIAGNGAFNGTDSAEGAVYTANAAALNDFVASGGGLMAHGSGPDIYGWLTALLPGIVEIFTCESFGAMLTPEGMMAFPGLTTSDVDSSAGPCHSHFEGDFGGLVPLVLDGTGVAYIIGGGGGTTIASPCATACDMPESLHVDAANHALVGTSGDDILCGDERNNTLRGQAGNDLLCGFEGDDFLQGAAGDDVLDGGEGDDILRDGAGGNDTMLGGEGDDGLFGDAGNDLLDGGPGNDTLRDNHGDDTLMGGDGDDLLNSGAGNDALDGGAGTDRLHGGGGTDSCTNGEKNIACEL